MKYIAETQKELTADIPPQLAANMKWKWLIDPGPEQCAQNSNYGETGRPVL